MSVAAALKVCKQKGWLKEEEQRGELEKSAGEVHQNECRESGVETAGEAVDELEELFSKLLREERDEQQQQHDDDDMNKNNNNNNNRGRSSESGQRREDETSSHTKHKSGRVPSAPSSRAREEEAPLRSAPQGSAGGGGGGGGGGGFAGRGVETRTYKAKIGDPEQSQQQWLDFTQQQSKPSAGSLLDNDPTHELACPLPKISFKIGRGKAAAPKHRQPHRSQAPDSPTDDVSSPQSSTTEVIHHSWDSSTSAAFKTPANASQHAPASSSEAASKTNKTPLLIVVDTNCFIDHLDDVEAAFQASIAVVVPLVVASELDKLKASSRSSPFPSPFPTISFLFLRQHQHQHQHHHHHHHHFDLFPSLPSSLSTTANAHSLLPSGPPSLT
jgi:hypothetical protein